jgi:hypothetical protein
MTKPITWTLYCSDFEDLGGCCGSCHDDEEDGVGGMLEYEPPLPTQRMPCRNDYSPYRYAEVCCGHGQLTRSDFAAALRNRRNKKRGERPI